MADLGHYPEYDEWLLTMADAQRYKLRINRHKGFLGDMNPQDIIHRLKEEVEELEDALNRGSKIESILEAADVANFAMAVLISSFGGKNVSERVEGNELRAPLVDSQEGEGTKPGRTQLLHGNIRPADRRTIEASTGFVTPIFNSSNIP